MLLPYWPTLQLWGRMKSGSNRRRKITVRECRADGLPLVSNGLSGQNIFVRSLKINNFSCKSYCLAKLVRKWSFDAIKKSRTKLTKAEYVALSESVKTVVWLRSVLAKLGLKQILLRIFQDSIDCIEWATGGAAGHLNKRKHIDMKLIYIMSMLEEDMSNS